MRVVERQFSDFLRQPNDVVAELEEHDVVLRRRNAPALRLTQVARDEERSEALESAVGLLRSLAAHHVTAMRGAIVDAFAWTRFLPEDARAEFVHDLTKTLAACTELDNFAPLTQVLREWRATAEVLADPKLARRLKQPVAARGKRVARPR